MKTLTSIGIQKIGQRFVDSVDHADYTLNGVPQTAEPFRRFVQGASARVYIYFDDMPKIQQRSLLFMKLGIERNGPDFISLQKSAKVHKSPQLQGALGFERHKTQCRTIRLHSGLVQ